MKKVFIFLAACAMGTITLNAQSNTFPATGNVGIGTLAPTKLLQVNGGISQFGNTTDYSQFSSTGDLSFTGAGNFLVGPDRYAFRYSANQNYGLFFSATDSRFEFRDGGGGQIMWVTGSGLSYFKGSMAIGSTLAPSAKLEITPSGASALKINPYGTVAGNTGEFRMVELAANGTNFVGFKAPDNINSNRVWTLPATDGSAGQLLKTNGSGGLSWATDANTPVSLSGGGSTVIGGAYPNFTVTTNETDPVYSASSAAGISGSDISNWNTAYSWGDHAAAGYLTSESDPMFGASAAAGISGSDVSNWNTAYSWGDHAAAGYLTSESDPIFGASTAAGISGTDVSNWNTAYSWGNHATAGYLTAETDPKITSATANKVPRWNGSSLSDGSMTDNGTQVGIGMTPTHQLQLSSNDAAKPGSALWTVASDARLKTNISSFADGLDILNQINPVWFEYNGTANTPTGERFVGILAQDMQKIAPYMISNATYTDDNGVSSDYLEYDPNALLYILVNSVKELSATNSDLKSENESLLNRIEKLESAVYTTGMNDGSAKITVSEANVSMLGQNVPNPFDNSTMIPFRIPKGCNEASIMITDVAQGKVITIIPISCDETHISIEAGEIPSGTYTYSMIVDGKVISTKEMVLTK